MMLMQFTLPKQSDWCDNMLIRSYDYAPVLPVKVSRPYFSTRPQGACEKFGVWGRDYKYACPSRNAGEDIVRFPCHTAGLMNYLRPTVCKIPIHYSNFNCCNTLKFQMAKASS